MINAATIMTNNHYSGECLHTDVMQANYVVLTYEMISFKHYVFHTLEKVEGFHGR